MLRILQQNFYSVPPPEWVNTEKDCRGALDYLDKANLIAVDTETTGLNRFSDTVIVFSVSDGVRRFAVHGKFLLLFKRLFAEKPLIFHNAKFDKFMLRNSGLIVPNTGKDYDTRTMMHWLDQSQPKTLERLSEQVGLWKTPYSEVFEGADLTTIIDSSDVSALAKLADYASWDAFVTYKGFEKLRQELEDLGIWILFQNLGQKLDAVLYGMELRGVHVDLPLLHEWNQLYEEKLQELERDFVKVAAQYGMPNINMRSPKQLSKLFYEQLSLPVIKTSRRTKAPSTDVEVIKTFADQGVEAAKILLEYRNVHKQRSTYLANLIEHADPNSRIHSEFFFTETHRLTSSHPNLQNIPRDGAILPDMAELGISFRRVFSAPPGKILLDADYDQAEINIAANFSKDPVLMDAIKHGKDIHSVTASKLFDVPYEKFVEAKKAENPTPEQQELVALRTKAKTINFQILYGVTAEGLGKRLGVSTDEAAGLIDKFYTQYPKLKKLFEKSVTHLFTHGYVRTIFGRIRKCRGIFTDDDNKLGHLVRIAQNTPIQGSVADIISNAMVRVWEDRELRENGVRLVLQIHDELLFEAPEDLDPKIMKRIEEIMTTADDGKLEISLTVDCHAGRNWKEAKGG